MKRRRKSVKRCALCKLNETRKRKRAREKLFVNVPGKISSKVVSIVENHEKRFWLTGSLQTYCGAEHCILSVQKGKSSKFTCLVGDLTFDQN